VVRLLESTLMRIGNDEYARQNGSYGITTLRSRHVDINGQQLRFGFPGKSSRRQEIKLSNRALARIVRRCQELPGQALFQFRDEHGKVKPIRSTEVNRYLRDAMGEEFTAKDFRTWAATVRVAATCVAAIEAGETPRIGAALSEAAQLLGNTPAVCRRAYVHPVVLAAFEQPAQAAALCEAFATRRGRGELRAEERAVLRYLRARPARDDCMAAQRATGAQCGRGSPTNT
jgi:DNA topoisomerase-1